MKAHTEQEFIDCLRISCILCQGYISSERRKQTVQQFKDPSQLTRIEELLSLIKQHLQWDKDRSAEDSAALQAILERLEDKT